MVRSPTTFIIIELKNKYFENDVDQIEIQLKPRD